MFATRKNMLKKRKLANNWLSCFGLIEKNESLLSRKTIDMRETRPNFFSFNFTGKLMKHKFVTYLPTYSTNYATKLLFLCEIRLFYGKGLYQV